VVANRRKAQAKCDAMSPEGLRLPDTNGEMVYGLRKNCGSLAKPEKYHPTPENCGVALNIRTGWTG
jgi:hypothetical protein